MSRPLLPIRLLALAALSAPALAGDPVPLTTHVSDQSGSVFFGPALGINEFGPAVGEPIAGARLDVTFEFDGTTPASELLLTYSVPIEGGTASWSVTGADLGFPSTGGTFTGSLENPDFAGVIANPSPFPFTPFEVFVGSTSGELHGIAHELRLTVDIVPRLDLDGPSLSVDAGGTRTLELNAGPSAGAGAPTLLLGSVSGTSPGVPLGAVCLPLNVDPYTTLLLQAPSAGPLDAVFAPLGPEGRRSASFTLPPASSPALAGLIVDHAFLVLGPGFSVEAASNASPLLLLP